MIDFNRRSVTLKNLFKFYFFKILKIKYAKFKTLIGEIYLDTINDGISKSYAIWGIREQDKHLLIFENIKKGDYVIDCGSNIGGYAKYINNLIGDNGKIICIEPDKRNHLVLKKNFNELSCKKEIYFAALSNNNAEAYIKRETKTNLSKVEIPKDEESEHEIINTINFDYLINEIGSENLKKFKLIRMDIEGHEVEVLENLTLHLDKFLNLDILFEVHSEYYNIKKFRNILKKFETTHIFQTVISAGGISQKIFIDKGLISKRKIISDGYERHIYKNTDFQKGIDLVLNIPRLLRYVYLKRI